MPCVYQGILPNGYLSVSDSLHRRISNVKKTWRRPMMNWKFYFPPRQIVPPQLGRFNRPSNSTSLFLMDPYKQVDLVISRPVLHRVHTMLTSNPKWIIETCLNLATDKMVKPHHLLICISFLLSNLTCHFDVEVVDSFV